MILSTTCRRFARSQSHVKRRILSNRMHNRRFTRLTNAFSKKWENHVAMFALYAAWYNYCGSTRP